METVKKPRNPRCPNGTVRDKKTGICIQKGKQKSPAGKIVNEPKKSLQVHHVDVDSESIAQRNKRNKLVALINKLTTLSDQQAAEYRVIRQELVDFNKNSKKSVKKVKIVNLTEQTPRTKRRLKMKGLLQKAVRKVTEPTHFKNISGFHEGTPVGSNMLKYYNTRYFKETSKTLHAMLDWLQSKYHRHVRIIKTQCLVINKRKRLNTYNWGHIQSYAEHHEKAVKEKKRFLMMYLTVQNINNTSSSHANVIIHDLKSNDMYRYDPHGWGGKYITMYDDIIKKIIKHDYKMHTGTVKLPTFRRKTYILERGPQYYDRHATYAGRCFIWTIAFMHKVLESPNTHPTTIMKEIGGDEKVAAGFIKKYISYLKNEMSFIDLHDKLVKFK